MEIRPLASPDRTPLAELLSHIETFTPDEVACALELIDAALTPNNPDYQVRCAIRDGKVVGYVCYGPAAEPEAFDLYWIVIATELQGRGHGYRLLSHVEAKAREAGARRLLIETSEANARARSFYVANGYAQVLQLKDFGRIRAGRVVFSRDLSA